MAISIRPTRRVSPAVRQLPRAVRRAVVQCARLGVSLHVTCEYSILRNVAQTRNLKRKNRIGLGRKAEMEFADPHIPLVPNCFFGVLRVAKCGLPDIWIAGICES